MRQIGGPVVVFTEALQISLFTSIFSGVAPSSLLSWNFILSVGVLGLSSRKEMEISLFHTQTPSILLLQMEFHLCSPQSLEGEERSTNCLGTGWGWRTGGINLILLPPAQFFPFLCFSGFCMEKVAHFSTPFAATKVQPSFSLLSL